LDWETAVGYQAMTLEKFKSETPTEPVVFRVKLKPSNHYNYQFRDPRRYRAVELSYPGNPDFRLVGYIKRSKQWAPKLLDQLGSGMAPSLIVRLKYPSRDGGEVDLGLVEIDSIVAETWWP
jgi:hypothetical protein